MLAVRRFLVGIASLGHSNDAVHTHVAVPPSYMTCIMPTQPTQLPNCASLSCRWDRAADYAKDANAWAAEIKRQFPEVRIMAVAAHSIEMQAPNDRGSCWNTELYPLLSENIDGVVIHPYLHLTDPKTGGGPLQPGIPARTASEGPTGWYEYAPTPNPPPPSDDRGPGKERTLSRHLSPRGCSLPAHAYAKQL